jgi:hypothetical protein
VRLAVAVAVAGVGVGCVAPAPPTALLGRLTPHSTPARLQLLVAAVGTHGRAWVLQAGCSSGSKSLLQKQSA